MVFYPNRQTPSRPYMEDYGDQLFIRALKVPPPSRGAQDLAIIHAFLRGLEALSWLREPALRSLCHQVRYETHTANDILYCRGEIATCWYILLSGSVFIDGSMFLPRSSFGKRSQGGGRRQKECLILETSGLMVIDYNEQQLHAGQRTSVPSQTFEKVLSLEPQLRGAAPKSSGANHTHPMDAPHTHQYHPHSIAPLMHQSHPSHVHPGALLHQMPNQDTILPDLLLRGGRSRGSVGSSVRDGSDTSSAYSGSDTMCQSIHSLDHDDVDLSGLMESVVDSDEEDLVENVENLSVRDAVRECLEKDPTDRSEDDVKVLLEFTERLTAFSNMTLAVRRAMCQAMVFAVVEDADTILMNDGEELDSWSVIINGHVEVTMADGSVHKLPSGESFGITPTMAKLFHRGVMRSKVDDCQFLCIRQSDYYRILHQGEENTKRHEEDGVTVMVTENRHIEACHKKASIVIKGTPERLMLQLVEVENEIDPTYVEDFLLTHRTFINNPLIVAKKLLEWFDEPKHQDRVTRVILRWVQSHFTDFEMDQHMMNFLEQFEEGLERKDMTGQLLFLRVVCMTKARSRVITLSRPSRDRPLQFTILGGKETGIFISTVDKGSKAEDVGLKRADQILEANGQRFKNMDRTRALDVIMSTCHLALTVKSNLHAYNEMLQMPEHPHKNKPRKELCGNGHYDFMSTLNLSTTLSPQLTHVRKEGKGTSMTLKAHRIKERFANLVHTKAAVIETPVCSDDSVSSHSSTGGPLYRSRSNPDLSTTGYEDNHSKSEFPDHVLKVYRALDQSTRFLPVHKETSAREVVMLSLRLFTMSEASQDFALYEASVSEGGVVKQKRLPDSMQNLAERIGLSSRYYLKSVTSSQNLCPEEVINELVRESVVNILQLNSVELAIQLTLEDFAIFRQIEPTEYIDNLFKLKSKYGTPALSKFEDISNKELFWVCTEVCSEHNLVKRAKIVKHFIKIAKYCKDVKNFNSMFAILSGLGSGCVKRLRQTWARVSGRYKRMFDDLETIMDPSRNMSKYRNLISSESSSAPMIPFFPIVKKDLSFTNEGNDDKVDGLINFEKLRMISRSIRELGHMCSTRFEPNKMLEQLGQPSSTAMSAMNQGITGGHQSATVKRRKKSTAQPDKKKMFEEAQMVRRVKSYLSKLKVIGDEDVLLKMSQECEAPPNASHTSSIGTIIHLANNTSSNIRTTSIGSSIGSSVGSSTSSNSSGSSGQQGLLSSSCSNSAPVVPPGRRRPESPTPSTTSSTSSTSEGKKLHARFGAASPSSERKMMSLAESSKKPYHGPRPVTVAAFPSSPNPSPGALRRLPGVPASVLPLPSGLAAPTVGPTTVRVTHERSHSDTPPVSSVDLNAESSSVTSLSNLRKSVTSTGSMMSSGDCQSINTETDSGISSHYDCHSSLSLEAATGNYDSTNSRHYPATQQSSPPTQHRRFSHQPGPGLRPHRRVVPAAPPDYTSTQLRIHMGRALSHDGVHYYTQERRDEEEEAQVSAV